MSHTSDLELLASDADSFLPVLFRIGDDRVFWVAEALAFFPGCNVAVVSSAPGRLTMEATSGCG